MNFFDDRDFGKHLEPHLPINAECATIVANSKLERDGIKGFAQQHRGEWTFTERQMKGDTHRALLINLEEIKPCAHEKEKVEYIGLNLYDMGGNYFKCACGAKVEPIGFAEVKK